MSGPEVIETANGVEEFDSRDRALVWRTSGGKHRYLLGDCQGIVAESIQAFRTAAVAAIDTCRTLPVALSLAALEAEQTLLRERVARFGDCADPLAIWALLGVENPERLPMLEADVFQAAVAGYRLGVPA